MTTIKQGSRGNDVKTLQRKLNLAVDGIFGPLTTEAVKEFQLSKGLVADGIVGPKTWMSLNAIPSINTRKSRRLLSIVQPLRKVRIIQ